MGQTTTLAGTPPPGRAVGPSSPPALLLVRAHPLEALHLRRLDELFTGSDRGTPFVGSVRGIGTRDQFEGFEQQPPTRIANSPSAAVTARLVVNPNHVVHLQ